MRVKPRMDKILDDQKALPPELLIEEDWDGDKLSVFQQWAGKEAFCRIIKNTTDEVIVISAYPMSFEGRVNIRILRWYRHMDGSFGTPSIDEEFDWPTGERTPYKMLVEASNVVNLMVQSMWYSNAFKVEV